MDDLIATLLVWISLQVGCEVPAPPQVRQVAPAVLVELSYGPDPPREDTSVVALYERRVRAIYLSSDWRAGSLKDRSALVHELVHHMQEVTGMPYPCLAAREKLAYQLQAKWLREENGIEDPYPFMGVDEFTILVQSLCSQSE